MKESRVGYIGDGNPVQHGGGVVFEDSYGYHLEYTDGLDVYDNDEFQEYLSDLSGMPVGDDDDAADEDADPDARKLIIVYTIDIFLGDNLIDEYPDVGWDDTAEAMRMTPQQFRTEYNPRDPMHQASMWEQIVWYRGLEDVADSSEIKRVEDVELRWSR